MVQLNSHLDAYEKLEELTPLPPGEYPVVILNSELKETRNGNSMVSLTYEVSSGPYQGRKIFDNLNLWHTNVKAVEIAHRTLKSIAIACGHPNPNYIGDTSELHGREMVLKVAIRRDDQGAERQDVKAYYAPGTTFPAPAAAPCSAAKPHSPAAFAISSLPLATFPAPAAAPCSAAKPHSPAAFAISSLPLATSSDAVNPAPPVVPPVPPVTPAQAGTAPAGAQTPPWPSVGATPPPAAPGAVAPPADTPW